MKVKIIENDYQTGLENAQGIIVEVDEPKWDRRRKYNIFPIINHNKFDGCQLLEQWFQVVK